MTVVEQTDRLLRKLAPAADIDVDHYPAGRVWFNVRQPNRFVSVEYRPGSGFHVSAIRPTSAWTGFGDRPQHRFDSYAAASRFLHQMFKPAAVKSGRSRPNPKASGNPRKAAVHG